jgi:asparagine synthase (glutamine-hydrolysing)
VCGITGYSGGFGRFDRDAIRKATATLNHRGPDHLGVFLSDDIALGAVRLRVMDPQAADQPLHSEDGRFVLVYNGEIYNQAALRQELECSGRRFRSRCDAEVVLASFQEWDTGCLRRFRGMFAFAIWDQLRQRLVLARDRLGIKPLYITRVGRGICFGSELKAILIHPNVTRNIDHQALRDFLSLNYVPGPRTLIEGIEKLPPGHFLEYREGEAQTESYWQLPRSRPSKISIGEASSQLDHLLGNSVREHLASDVPLGIWLSGGLDSTTLVDYAARQTSTPIKTFSVAFESNCCDERKWFREVSRFYGTQHEEIELRPDGETISAVQELAYYSDEPGADAGALPVWFLSKLSRKHVTVALSGEGSDELFGGYLTYQANSYADELRRLPAWARSGSLCAIERLWPASDEKISFEYKVKRLLGGSMMHPDEAHVYWNGTFTSGQVEALLGPGTPHSLQSLYSSGGFDLESKGLSRYLHFDQRYYLPDNLLYKVDRMSMAHSLEVRPPFLDHRIVEFAATLPDNLKINGRSQKYLLRHLMQSRVPKPVTHRSKTGFDIPAHRWLRGELRPLLMDTLSREAIRQTGIFSPGIIGQLINDHMERKINVGYHLWGLMTLFLWLRKWKVEICPRQEQEVSSEMAAIAT